MQLVTVLGVLATAVLLFSSTGVVAEEPYKVVCYFEAWAVYRPGKGKHDVEDIAADLCTHHIYGFAGLSNKHTIISLDPWNDLYDDYGRGAFLRFTKMKQKSPQIKTMLSIGGWNEGSKKYSVMAASAAYRKTFIDSVVKFLHKYHFDGLDLDWEYPTQRGGAPEDVDNYIQLLKEMSEAFKPRGLLMSAAIAPGRQTIDVAYHLPEMGKYLDFMNVMAYDYHGDWDPFIGHNSPLYLSQKDIEHGDNFQWFSVNYTVSYYKQSLPPEKMVMGFPFYGRGFRMANAANHEEFDPSNGPMANCPYSEEAGFCGYNELCERIFSQSGWTHTLDEEQQAIHAIKGTTYIGYDDLDAVKRKVEYLKKMGLGGAMVWAIDTDDFRGLCGGQTYPLLNAIWSGLNGPVPDPSPMPTTTPDPTAPTHHTHKPHPTLPPGPTPAPSHVCKQAGLNPDPDKMCSPYFYECEQNGSEWTYTQFTCGDGSVYDREKKVCVWPADSPECNVTETPPL